MVLTSSSMSKSGDFTHLLNHPALRAFDELNQEVDMKYPPKKRRIAD